MKFRLQASSLLFLVFWPLSVSAGQAFRDSTLMFTWVEALAKQEDARLNSAVVALTQEYLRHFPTSSKNAELLQIQGESFLKEKKPYRAFVSFLKQLTVYPDSNRDYQSKKELIRLVLTQKKLQTRSRIVANFLTDRPRKTQFRQGFLALMNQLYWLDLKETDQIALQELADFLQRGPKKNGLDELIYEQARMFQRNGRSQEALWAYASLLRDWPQSENVPLSIYHIGELFRNKLKNKKMAAAIFGVFLKRFPHHYLAAFACFQLAALEEANGSIQAAALDYARFVRQSGEKSLRALGFYHLGRLYEKKFGDKRKADFFYTQFFNLYPSKKEARRAIKAFRLGDD